VTDKKGDTTKKLVGIVCVLHGTFDGLTKCPLCDGFRVNGASPACPGGCGAAVKPARRFAFTPVVHNDRKFPGGSAIIMARTDEGTRGYTALLEMGAFTTMDVARRTSDHLNGILGLDERTAALITASTMHFRESELVTTLRRGLALMEQVRNGTADDADVDEWADDARRLAQV